MVGAGLRAEIKHPPTPILHSRWLPPPLCYTDGHSLQFRGEGTQQL